MIRYNAYFGRLIASQKAWPGGNLRAQKEPLEAASYVRADVPGPQGLSHASLGLDFYAHCSSPIRRFADLVNQYAVFSPGSFKDTDWGDAQLATLNDRVVEIKRYHASVDAMELAYGCRTAPRVYRGRVEADDEMGLCLLVETEKRRVRVPLHDSYFAEPIVDAVAKLDGADRPWHVELCGVLIASRTRLRARLVADDGQEDVIDKPKAGWADQPPPHGVAPSTTTKDDDGAAPEKKDVESLPAAAEAYLKAATIALEDEREAAAEERRGNVLQESEVNEVIGYPIDDFQRRSLAVITDPPSNKSPVAKSTFSPFIPPVNEPTTRLPVNPDPSSMVVVKGQWSFPLDPLICGVLPISECTTTVVSSIKEDVGPVVPGVDSRRAISSCNPSKSAVK